LLPNPNPPKSIRRSPALRRLFLRPLKSLVAALYERRLNPNSEVQTHTTAAGRGFSCGTAAEGNPRREPWAWGVFGQAPTGAKDPGKNLPPLPGLMCAAFFPRLTPWAAIYRNSVASEFGLKKHTAVTDRRYSE